MKRVILYRIVFGCVLLLHIHLASAQKQISESNSNNLFDLGQRPEGFLNALINPAKFSMHHSYSLSYYSVGKQGSSQGLYLNTMSYQFSNPLSMQVRIGYLHQPFGGFGQTLGMNKVFLQRAMLQYKPSENMIIKLDYQQLPATLFNPYQRWHMGE